MKRSHKLLIVAMLVVPLLCSIVPVNQVKAEGAYTRNTPGSEGIRGAKVNIRSGPGTDYSVLTQMTNTVVMVTGNYNGWYEVMYKPGKYGYVYSLYCVASRDGYFVVHAKSGLNIRSDEGTKYPVLYKMSDGTRCAARGPENEDEHPDWAEIIYANYLGCVSRKYTEKLYNY